MPATVYCTATIRQTPEDKPIELRLKLDADNCFRWYTADGRDTEVSGSTMYNAILAADSAWRTWDFQVPGSSTVTL